jgi:hypothetical protein
MPLLRLTKVHLAYGPMVLLDAEDLTLRGLRPCVTPKERESAARCGDLDRKRTTRLFQRGFEDRRAIRDHAGDARLVTGLEEERQPILRPYRSAA